VTFCFSLSRFASTETTAEGPGAADKSGRQDGKNLSREFMGKFHGAIPCGLFSPRKSQLPRVLADDVPAAAD